MPKKKHNTPYTIEVSDPLLRPGMTITAGPVSEKYVSETARRMMEMVREINSTSSVHPGELAPEEFY
jgi:hypothetical protein